MESFLLETVGLFFSPALIYSFNLCISVVYFFLSFCDKRVFIIGMHLLDSLKLKGVIGIFVHLVYTGKYKRFWNNNKVIITSILQFSGSLVHMMDCDLRSVYSLTCSSIPSQTRQNGYVYMYIIPF